MQRYIIKKATFLLLAMLLTFSANAQAKPGLAIINYGDELFDVADFQHEYVSHGQARSAHMKIGYKCAHFGLFWADVYTWNCKMVEILGADTYRPLPMNIETQLKGSPHYKFSKAKRSFWNQYAFWMFATFFSLWLYRQQKKYKANVLRKAEVEKARRWHEARLRQEQRKNKTALVQTENTPESKSIGVS